MQVHELTQGSQEWLAFRSTHFGASEAAAMLGLSKTTTRPELLHMKATGLTPEFTAWVQKNVLDHGHVVEGLTLPLIEKHIGDDLFPATCSEGKISASCDGLTMGSDIAWENKQPNAEIVAQVKAGQMPEQHMPQCQQVLMVTGAKKLIFSVSDGTGVLHVLDVLPDPAWFERLRAGWAQFEIDLAAYVPTEATAPAPTGRAPETLPALFITVKGEVTESNLANFKDVALSAIRSVNRDLKTDQDFADADKAVKWCSDIEDRVAGAKQHALSQTATIDTLFKTMDDISAEARQVRLDLEKLVKARKVSLKTEMLTEAQTALGDHIRALNIRLERDYMPQVPVDFAGAITNKRNFDSMRAALDVTLANAKIAANATADKIAANLKVLREQAADYKFLFADTAQIVLKAPDDLQALVTLRISEHKAAEQKKQDDAREAMRLDLEAKAAAASRAALAKIQGIQNQVQAAQGAKPAVVLQIIADIEAVAVDETAFGVHSELAVDAKRKTLEELRALAYHPNGAPRYSTTTFRSDGEPIMLNEDGTRSVFCDVDEDYQDAPAAAPTAPQTAAAPAPAANVVPMRAAAPDPVRAPATPPTLKLGVINDRLAPISITAAGMAQLGFAAAGKSGSAVLYHERDFPFMCAALIKHVESVQGQQAA